MKAQILMDNAVLVADAHADFNRREFLDFLRKIYNGEIVASQLIMLGDMFDFYAPQCDFSARFAAPYLNLIAQISKKIPVFYIEGNHDFCLKKSAFKVKQNIAENSCDTATLSHQNQRNLSNLNPQNEQSQANQSHKFIYQSTPQNGIFIIPFSAQPLHLHTPFGTSIAIAHGDNHLPFFTQRALLFLRQRWLLKSLNFIDCRLRYKISRRLFKHLLRKKLDYKIENFAKIADEKMRKYSDKIVIEGHFHQGEIFKFKDRIYANVPSFALECRYFVVKYDNEKINFAQMSLKGH